MRLQANQLALKSEDRSLQGDMGGVQELASLGQESRKQKQINQKRKKEEDKERNRCF